MVLPDKRQTEVRSDLTDYYQGEGVVLFLGAGISVKSGLPNWYDLTNRILTHGGVFGENDGNRKFCKLVRVGYKLETILGMAEDKVFSDYSDDRENAQKAFTAIIRDCLYRDFEYQNRDITVENARSFATFVETRNKTLSAVYDLAVLWESNETMSRRNPRVHSIVNFNLDALLQAYDRARHRLDEVSWMNRRSSKDNRRLRTIERPTAGSIPERTSVYHPHGFLRFDSSSDDPTKEAPDLRILTEYEYYSFYNRSTEMYTYTLLHLLREHHCVFIGLSMTDENIRRLLFYSRDEEKRSYERERPSFRGFSPRRRRHFAVLKTSESDIDRLAEKSLAGLGVNTVWVNDFDELHELLDKLKRSNDSKPSIAPTDT